VCALPRTTQKGKGSSRGTSKRAPAASTDSWGPFYGFPLPPPSPSGEIATNAEFP
jgi:hypothetical protein